MTTIPEKIQLQQPWHQKDYLLDGELKIWEGETAEVYSSISTTTNYQPTGFCTQYE